VNCCVAYDIHLPVHMILLGKALITAEGTCLMLEPELNFVDESRDIVDKIVKNEIKSDLKLKNLLRKSLAWKQLLSKLPGQTLSLVDTLQRKGIRIDIEDADVKRLGFNIDTSSNRLSYSLIIAALIVGGATFATVAPSYQWGGLLAGVCLIIAVILSFIFFYSVSKEGKKRSFDKRGV